MSLKLTFVILCLACSIHSSEISRQTPPDDAIVIEADGTSTDGITPIDGPDGTSIIGSIDNVFKAVKDYDQYKCIERMICEAMMSGGDDIPGLNTIVQAVTGEASGPITQASVFGEGGGSRPPGSSLLSGGSIFGTLEELFFGQQRRSGSPSRRRPPPPPGRRGPPPPPRRQRFRPPPPPQRRRRPPPPPFASASRRESNAHHEQFDDFRPSKRIKRQTRLQGNIIRLMQATGMDSYNAYPYVRAALIGHSHGSRTRGTRITRRGNACSQLYRDCPTDPGSLLNYFNNHNGGVVNQVQPVVDDEVGPIIQAIVADVVGGDEGGSSSSSSSSSSGSSTSSDNSFLNSDIFQTGDALFTNAIINGASSVFENGLDGVVDAIVGKKKK